MTIIRFLDKGYEFVQEQPVEQVEPVWNEDALARAVDELHADEEMMRMSFEYETLRTLPPNEYTQRIGELNEKWFAGWPKQ